ncbi:BZ3500_MvSof-1268-A1-R1_Chr6-3g08718 [Microbotryum saponariae]|uniref:BZ3500_MvSof-1268-A1-R1_Chr6-3g08718 protein n=1 Tax=Microbotryum saponariae TaxID=289078 RepID=A0A2X0LMW4_9BASI|nr:BZ3500_MvSof-1268-A1-R1_Chr6-3g08718 [Microbotryum saponariae]SDA07319.1 BZ3501_MvSof-1269-A2-R1_Chr6-2g08421 [Microbotryum saponariae]
MWTVDFKHPDFALHPIDAPSPSTGSPRDEVAPLPLDTTEAFEAFPNLPGLRRPSMALKDPTLEMRMERSLSDFLNEHDLADSVLAETREVTKHELERCYPPQSIADHLVFMDSLRKHALKPLLHFLAEQYHKKLATSGSTESWGTRLRVKLCTEKPPLPSGITVVITRSDGRSCSQIPILFEDDANFLRCGPEPDVFTGCLFHLDKDGKPFPLDSDRTSYGAQAMLNKLAFMMESSASRPSSDTTPGENKLPVRFGLVLSSNFGMIAETVADPQHPQEVGLLFSPPPPFEYGSLPLMLLAIVVDQLAPVAAPSPCTLRLLFDVGPERCPPAQLPVQLNEEGVAPRAVKRRRTKNRNAVPPSSVVVLKSTNQVVRATLNSTACPSRMLMITHRDDLDLREAVTFEVFDKAPHQSLCRPCLDDQRHRLSSLPPELLAFLWDDLDVDEDPPNQAALSDLEWADFRALPALQVPLYLASGSVSSVSAGKLRPSVLDNTAAFGFDSGAVREERKVGTPVDCFDDGLTRTIPPDHPVVIKYFPWHQLASAVRESLFYEHVFPLLPSRARVFLPPYYGTYRSADGSEVCLVLGYGGRRIQRADYNDALKLKIDEAFRVFRKQGVHHGDQAPRNVLLREDGSLCLIDWNVATVDFDPRARRPTLCIG